MTGLVEAIGRAIAAADNGDYVDDRELYDEDRQRYDARARGALTAIDAAGFAIVPKEPGKEGQRHIVRAADRMRDALYGLSESAASAADLVAAMRVKP